MPRKALRCIVDLKVNSLSAPGVWLPSREDVYLSITLFDQYRNTRLLTSIFPLIIHEKFRFEKTFYTAVDPSQVSSLLEDELVIFELVQLSEYSDGAVRLATFAINARDFLYPYPSLAPTYASADREILMTRTVAFPGISPKIEFSTKTVIKESISPEIDALDDALEEEKERRRIRGRPKSRQSSVVRTRSRSPSLSVEFTEEDKNYWKPTVSSISRSRSPSPTYCRRMEEIDLNDTVDSRPPFVVRKLDKSLIGRLPGGPPTKHAKTKPRLTKRSRSASRSSLGTYDIDTYSPLRHQYHLREVLREPGEEPLPVFESRAVSDDEDAEVAALTSMKDEYPVSYRPRSASPILYKPSFSARYGRRSTSPIPRRTVEDLVSRELARERRIRQRLRSLSPPLIGRSSPYSYQVYDLDDLDLHTHLVKSRRKSSSSLVHLGDGRYWTPQAAELSGKSHRQLFTDNLSKTYNHLYLKARKLDAQCEDARLFI